MAKKQDNEVNALSHSVFRRMVKGARMSLNGIRAEIDEIPGEHPQAAARFAALREAAKEEHAAFMQRADAYMEAEHLPEGLSEEELLEGIQQVKTLHQQIRCLLAVTCPIAPTHPATHSLAARLPQIPLPHFDGDFRRWVAFRDTFTALVVNQPDLTDVERLLYLRDALQGDAIATIQNIPVREGQFQAAWDTLHQAYDNQRLLAHQLLSQLLTLPPPPTTPSAEHLQLLLSEGMASAEALLEIRAPDLASFLVFALFARHVDGETLREFESSHVDVEFPTVGHLKVFLWNTLRALRLALLCSPRPRSPTPPRKASASARVPSRPPPAPRPSS